jgi:hypothetical protein
MAADVPAGLGYLAGGVAAAAVGLVAARRRKEIARSLIDGWTSSAARASPRRRSLHGTWGNERWRDPAFRERSLLWIWLPMLAGFSVLALVFLLSAASEFAR